MKKPFRCGKCLKEKKSELYSHDIKINGATRKVCTWCNERIQEADERILATKEAERAKLGIS